MSDISDLIEVAKSELLRKLETTLTVADLSNLRVLLSGAALETGRKSDQQWQAVRANLYDKLARVRDELETS